MTNEPDFTNLVGDEGSSEELDRLRRVHDMLVAAGPPPELSPAMAHPPDVEESKVVAIGRRRPTTMIALAAALAVVTFLVGYAVADKRTGFSSKAEVPMHGIGLAHSAHADIAIGSHDVSGNYPLQMTVQGLKPLPRGGWYELLLSKHGKPTLSCGTFTMDGQPLTIRLSVPYDLSEFGKLFDGWVVVKHLPKQASSPVVMTT